MNYTVPVYELEKLEKKLNHIRNKGVDVTFKKGEPYKVPVYMEHPDPITHTVYRDHEPTYIKVVDVEVEGHYGIEGWEFVGTIEHKGENGNIIRAINDNFKIPEEFYTKGPACDHCHRIRDRKDTYLIRNTKTGEYKQVGKTCLKEYTGGLDANACAEWHTLDMWLAKLYDAEAHQYNGGAEFGDIYYNGNLIKQIAYAMIRDNGYKKASAGTGTAYQVEDAYVRTEKRPKQLGTEEEIKAIDEWVAQKEQSLKVDDLIGDDNYFNSYLRNAIVAWKEKYPEDRDLPLVVSLINTYFKDIQEKARIQKNKEESTSDYLGKVGDNIEFTVVSYRLLYIKDNYYNGPSTRVYQMNDDKGNIVILETSTIDMSDYNDNDIQSNAGTISKGLKMKAKVKAHKEYKGIKQTVVNRAKILNESMSTKDALDYLKA